MPIAELSYYELQKLAKTHECGQCHSGVTVAWVGGKYVLRCARDLNHNSICNKKRYPDYLEKEIYKSMTTQMVKMDEKTMLARVERAKFPSQLSVQDKKFLANVALDYGLDPIMGELTLYQGNPYVTIGGRRRKAIETGEYDGGSGRPATKEEMELQRVDPDDYLWKFEVYKKNCSRPFEAWGKVTKKQIERAIEFAQKKGNDPFYLPLVSDPAGMAEKRAETKALKRAFYLPLPSFEDIGSEADPEPVKPFVDSTAIEVEGKIVEPVPVSSPEPKNGKATKQAGFGYTDSDFR